MAENSIQQLDELMSMIAAPVLVVDLQTERVILLNDKAEELTGYKKNNLKNLTVLDLFDSKYSKTIQALIDLSKSQKTGIKIHENDVELRRRTGRLCSVSLYATQYHFQDGLALIFTLVDLTDVKNKEKERTAMLNESARVSKLADIGRLAGGIAHELNNPLAILLGYVENLDFLISENQFTKEDIRKNFEPIYNSASRMAKIISKMMALIRHESTHLQTLSVAQVVRESLIILEDILSSNSITLKVELNDAWIRCDSTHIEQIITNIISNACSALESRKENREIIIRALRPNYGQVQIEIWNNGSPIPEEVQAKIFTPFFTTKSVGEGTGLGLYLCYSIMKAHSGEMTFQSSEAQGTSFFLTFPEAEKVQNFSPDKTLRALVIDDDTFFRKMLCQKLKQLKVDATEVRTGAEALEILQNPENTFDLFLVDVKMPKMNGLEFVEKMRETNSTGYTVMITGDVQDPNLISKLQTIKAQAVLAKPIQNTELTQILDTLRDNTDKKVA